jgi:hypothetical protein
MPALQSISEFRAAVEAFAVQPLGLTAQPAALAEARRSLDTTGLVLMGEVHGVRQNPLLIRDLVHLLDINVVALEWPVELGATLAEYTRQGRLADHPLLWVGDGRVTAGHFAVLRALAEDRGVRVVLFDNASYRSTLSWSEMDAAMSRRLLRETAPSDRTLVVAGNAHTPTQQSDFGIPLGAHLAARRPGVSHIAVRYLAGSYFNFQERQFAVTAAADATPRLLLAGDELVLELARADAAAVLCDGRFQRFEP